MKSLHTIQRARLSINAKINRGKYISIDVYSIPLP